MFTVVFPWTSWLPGVRSQGSPNLGQEPRLFPPNRPISGPWDFTRNPHQQPRKQLEIHLQAYRRRFREFGAISRTYQNPPCSKPWAVAQAFCSKSANFRPLRIHPKSTPTIPQAARNPFAGTYEAFQGDWSNFQHLPNLRHVQNHGL